MRSTRRRPVHHLLLDLYEHGAAACITRLRLDRSYESRRRGQRGTAGIPSRREAGMSPSPQVRVPMAQVSPIHCQACRLFRGFLRRLVVALPAH